MIILYLMYIKYDMSKKPQTAVDYLMSEIRKDQSKRAKSLSEWTDIYNYAESLMARDIAEAWNDGNFLGRNPNIYPDYDTGESYYKKTYK